jgi:hypothetical protein
MKTTSTGLRHPDALPWSLASRGIVTLPLTPALSPSEEERVPGGRVRGNPDGSLKFLASGVLSVLVLVVAPALGLAQGAPEDNGLWPVTATFDANAGANNSQTEHAGVSIGDNNNVIIGWEDDFGA